MRAAYSTCCVPAVCLAALLGAPYERAAFAFSPEAVECLDHATDAAARMACANAEVNAQAKALATAVQRLKAAGDKQADELLTKAQQAWLAHRDAHCAWMADRLRRDAQAQRIERLLCVAGATEARAQEIEDYQNVP